MAKVSAALRQRLLGQKASMGSGVVIRPKEFTRGVFRALPVKGDDELPGTPVTSLFSKALKKGTTSPRTFGAVDPVLDELESQMRGKSKDAREELRAVVNSNTEYYMAVVDRSAMGTPAKPELHVFPMRQTPYTKIINYMVDEEDGEDITNVNEGRDFRLVKDTTGGDTKWDIAKWFDKSQLGQKSPNDPVNPQMHKALVAAAEKFDAKDHIRPVDWKLLNEMYEQLTGSGLPDEYADLIASGTGDGFAADDAVDAQPDAPAEDAPAEDAPAEDAPAEDATAEESADAPELSEGVRVSFKDADENEVLATIVSMDATDDAGDPCIDVRDDNGGEWQVQAEQLTVLIEEPEPEEVPQPKPKPAAPKPAAPKPAAPKPAASKVSGAAPKKPSALSKPTAKPPASTSIASRLAATRKPGKK